MADVKNSAHAAGIVPRVIAEIVPQADNSEQVYGLIDRLVAMDANAPGFNNAVDDLKAALPQTKEIRVLVDEFAQYLRTGNDIKPWLDRPMPAASKQVRLELVAAGSLVAQNPALKDNLAADKGVGKDSAIAQKLPDLQEASFRHRLWQGLKAFFHAIPESTKEAFRQRTTEDSVQTLRKAARSFAGEDFAKVFIALPHEKVNEEISQWVRGTIENLNEKSFLNKLKDEEKTREVARLTDAIFQGLIEGLSEANDQVKSALDSYRAAASDIATKEHSKTIDDGNAEATDKLKDEIEGDHRLLPVARKGLLNRLDQVLEEPAHQPDQPPPAMHNQELAARIQDAHESAHAPLAYDNQGGFLGLKPAIDDKQRELEALRTALEKADDENGKQREDIDKAKDAISARLHTLSVLTEIVGAIHGASLQDLENTKAYVHEQLGNDGPDHRLGQQLLRQQANNTVAAQHKTSIENSDRNRLDSLTEIKNRIVADAAVLFPKESAELLTQLSQHIALPLEKQITEAHERAKKSLEVDENFKDLEMLKAAIDGKKEGLASTYDLLDELENTVDHNNKILTQKDKAALEHAIAQAKQTLDAQQGAMDSLRNNCDAIEEAHYAQAVGTKSFKDIAEGPDSALNQRLLKELNNAVATTEYRQSIKNADAAGLEQLEQKIKSDARLFDAAREDLLLQIPYCVDIRAARESAEEPLKLTDGKHFVAELEQSIRTKKNEVACARRELWELRKKLDSDKSLLSSSTPDLRNHLHSALATHDERLETLESLEKILERTKRATDIASGNSSLWAKKIAIEELKGKADLYKIVQGNKSDGQVSQVLLRKLDGYLQDIDKDLEKSGVTLKALEKSSFFEITLDGKAIQLRRFPDPDKPETLKLQYFKEAEDNDGESDAGEHGVFEVSIADLQKMKSRRIKKSLRPPNRLLKYVHKDKDKAAVKERATLLFGLLAGLPQDFSKLSLATGETIEVRRVDDEIFEYVNFKKNDTKRFDRYTRPKDFPDRLKNHITKKLGEHYITGIPHHAGGRRQILTWDMIKEEIESLKAGD